MTAGFGLDHLPYGVVDGHCVVRYEDHVLDLSTVPGLPPVFDCPTLNRFLALGRPVWEDVREKVTRVLEAGTVELRRDRRAASCRSRSATTSTSTPRSSTRPTSGASSARTTRSRPPGRRCRSATTAAPARSSSPAPRSCARTGCGRATAPPRSWTSSSSSGSSPGPASRSATRSAPPTCASTSSASCSSTTGARATSSASSTARSARSWASRSRPRSRPGSRRWPRWSPTWCPPASRTREPDDYLRTDGDWALDIALEVDVNGEIDHARQRPPPVLDVPAAARARDRQRRGRAPRRPVRLRARSPAPSPARHGCLLEAGTGFLADGDTVTLRGRAGTIELGAVRGTIVSEP